MASSTDSMKQKRLLRHDSDLSSPESEPAAKRPRDESVPSSTATHQAYELTVGVFHLDMPLDQFISLVAYLCAILRCGYPLDISQIDNFIGYYPLYETEIARLESERMHDPNIGIPAYHQWFLTKGRTVEHERPVVLHEDSLRKIWDENPYTFLQVQWRLESIAGRAQKKAERRNNGVSS